MKFLKHFSDSSLKLNSSILSFCVAQCLVKEMWIYPVLLPKYFRSLERILHWFCETQIDGEHYVNIVLLNLADFFSFRTCDFKVRIVTLRVAIWHRAKKELLKSFLCASVSRIFSRAQNMNALRSVFFKMRKAYSPTNVYFLIIIFFAPHSFSALYCVCFHLSYFLSILLACLSPAFPL